MKSLLTLRSTLGLTQTKLAALLNIKRSRLAAIETGRRELPATAYGILRELETLVATRQTKIKEPVDTDQLQNHNKLLAWELGEIVLQHRRIAQKIEALEKKQAAQLQGHHRADLGKTLKAKNDRLLPVYNDIELDGKIALAKDYTGAMMVLKLKLEALVFEKELFESKIKEVGG